MTGFIPPFDGFHTPHYSPFEGGLGDVYFFSPRLPCKVKKKKYSNVSWQYDIIVFVTNMAYFYNED